MIKEKLTITLSVAYNTLNYVVLENVLSENVKYESQNVMTPIIGKNNLLILLKGKFNTIKNSGNTVYAEIGHLHGDKAKPCIILSQGTKENKGALVYVEVEERKISAINICTLAPHWSTAIPTGEYPA